MAFLIEENRCTSPTSSAQVSAVIGPTAGMVMSRSTRSTSKESRSQRAFRFSQAHHCLPAQPQQRFQPFIDVLVGGQQFSKGSDLVELLFVVTRTGFHHQHSNFVLRLYCLADQQVPIAQDAPSFANFLRAHLPLRQQLPAQPAAN